MTQQIDNESYIKMVANLAKPGIDIMLKAKPETLHLWHMATGLVGEVIELYEAIANDDRENMIEELGDILFYMEGYSQGIQFNLYRVSGQMEEIEHLHVGLLLAGDIVDNTKKIAIYNKEMTQEKLAAPLAELFRFLKGVADQLDLTINDLQIANHHKLVGKKNARYKEGTYSDAQAQARADKQGVV